MKSKTTNDKKDYILNKELIIKSMYIPNRETLRKNRYFYQTKRHSERVDLYTK